MEKRRVLITGLGTVNPLGHNAADTWQAVRDGVCGIGPITRYDCSAQKVHLAAEVKDWDPTTVLDKKDVRHMSRYTQLAAAAAKEALADSGLIPEAEDRTRAAPRRALTGPPPSISPPPSPTWAPASLPSWRAFRACAPAR